MTTAAAGGETETALAALLEASLAMWGEAGRVETAGAGLLKVRTGAREIVIRRAPPALPLRWIVAHDGRERGAASVVGLLRQLRTALDPGYRPARLRIAAPPRTP